MTALKGFLASAATKKATTWGTPVAAGAGDGLELLKEDFAVRRQLIEDQQISGSHAQREADAGNKMASGSITSAARYEGLEPLIAFVAGTAGAPTTVDTSAKKHTIKMANSMEGIFSTLVIDKKIALFEYDTVKWTGFSLRCAAGQRAEITFRGTARDLAENVGSGTNNTTTYASVTLPSNREFLLFAHLVARVNAQSGGALAAGDAVYVTEINLDVDRPMSTEDVSTQFGYRIDEPLQSGFSVVKGSLGFAKYQDGTGGNSSLFTDAVAGTRKKMDWVFTGTGLAGAATQKFQWSLFFPNIQFGEATPQIGGPGLTAWTLPFTAYRVLTAPTGFTAGYLDPLTMEIYSQRSADALA